METGLLMRINGGGSSSPTRIIFATTKAAIVNFLQGGIVDAIMDSFFVQSVMQLILLMLTPKN